MAYKKYSKKKTREEFLKAFNEKSLNFDLCDVCKYNYCYNEKKDKNECFQPMRELYDEKYALEG